MVGNTWCESLSWQHILFVLLLFFFTLWLWFASASNISTPNLLSCVLGLFGINILFGINKMMRIMFSPVVSAQYYVYRWTRSCCFWGTPIYSYFNQLHSANLNLFNSDFQVYSYICIFYIIKHSSQKLYHVILTDFQISFCKGCPNVELNCAL